jgi:hypothetical protein
MADFGVSEGCSVDAIHASWVGGITVGKHGAFSVALSGGYEDDVDLGYALLVLFVVRVDRVVFVDY